MNTRALSVERIAMLAAVAITTLLATLALASPAWAEGTIKHDICPHEGTMEWDENTWTITMKNATVDTATWAEDDFKEYGNGIWIQAENFGNETPTIVLKLEGTNRVNFHDWQSEFLYVRWANLRVEGSGSLIFTATETESLIDVASGHLELKSGTIQAQGDGANIEANRSIKVTGAKVTLTNMGGSDGFDAGEDFKLLAGSVAIDGCKEGIFAGDGALVVNGASASLSVKNASFIGLHANGGNCELREGTVTVSNAEQCITVDDGKQFILNGAKVNISNARDFALLLAEGTLTFAKGSLSISSSKNSAIYAFDSKCIFSGATVTINGTTWCALETGNVTVSKGTLKIDGCQQGLDVYNTYNQTGGTVSAVNVTNIPLYASTKVNVTGGSLTVKTKNPTRYNAIQSSSIYVKPGCLKAATGKLPAGVTITASGSTYKVTSEDSSENTATLVSYGGSSKKPSINTVKIGGITYKVTAIGKKAFATKKGKAITQITLGKNVASIGANAFAGTAKLASINAKGLKKTVKLAKNAFAKCGKSGGKKLTITCSKANKKALQKNLVKKGLSKKAKFK